MITDIYSLPTFDVKPIADLERNRDTYINTLRNKFPDIKVLRVYNTDSFVCFEISVEQTSIDYFAFIISHGLSAYSNYWIKLCTEQNPIISTFIDAARERYEKEWKETVTNYYKK